MVSVNYAELQLCDTEGMIEEEYENRAWQHRSDAFFPPHFHCCFLSTFFLSLLVASFYSVFLHI